jgi:hypothetical protein
MVPADTGGMNYYLQAVGPEYERRRDSDVNKVSTHHIGRAGEI